jgi:hypothetical protein
MFIGNLISVLTALLAATVPSGTYVGSKTIFGETIGASVSFHDADTLDFAITGAFALNCADEVYQINGSEIVLTNIGVAGDCAHDALADNGVTLTDIVYDGAKDQITVSVKYSVAKIDLVLTPQNNFLIA